MLMLDLKIQSCEYIQVPGSLDKQGPRMCCYVVRTYIASKHCSIGYKMNATLLVVYKN